MALPLDRILGHHLRMSVELHADSPLADLELAHDEATEERVLQIITASSTAQIDAEVDG